jgi:Stress responsive A/B Barrel Domain
MYIKTILSIVVLVFTTHLVFSQKQQPEKAQLRHVVLFKFKDKSSADDIHRIEKAFGALSEKIKEIKGYEWGINNSPENIAQGFTHCFFLTFDSEADRDIYLPHPDHKAFGALLGPHLDKVLVLDYWAKN